MTAINNMHTAGQNSKAASAAENIAQDASSQFAQAQAIEARLNQMLSRLRGPAPTPISPTMKDAAPSPGALIARITGAMDGLRSSLNRSRDLLDELDTFF